MPTAKPAAQKTSSVPSSALPQMIKGCYHRLLILEIELRQMGREAALTSAQYRKRVLLLKALKTHLDACRHNPQKLKASVKGVHIFTEIPAQQQRSPEETLLCLRFLEASGRLTQGLLKESWHVLKRVKKAIDGRSFSLLTALDLSKLKRMLTKLEQQMGDYQQQKTSWSAFISSCLPPKAHNGGKISSPTLQVLKNSFLDLEKLHTEILTLRLDCEKQEDELDVMENWLSFQEWRMAQYYPLAERAAASEAAASKHDSRVKRSAKSKIKDLVRKDLSL